MIARRSLVLLAVAFALAGCGASKSAHRQTTASNPAPAAPTTTASTGTTPSAGALQAEANSAATGDVPDNQVYITFRAAAGYSMKYPEGWAQRKVGSTVTFRDKNNIVRVVVARNPAPTAAGVRHEVAALRGARLASGPTGMTISGAPAFKVVYTTQSAPNAVTGKPVQLMVDRYYLSHAGREAIVDLGTPKGVDNVDAYRLMIESFRWR